MPDGSTGSKFIPGYFYQGLSKATGQRTRAGETEAHLGRLPVELSEFTTARLRFKDRAARSTLSHVLNKYTGLLLLQALLLETGEMPKARTNCG